MQTYGNLQTLSYGEGGGGNAPRVVLLLYILNSLFLGAEIFRLFLRFYGESFVIQFELVRFRLLPW